MSTAPPGTSYIIDSELQKDKFRSESGPDWPGPEAVGVFDNGAHSGSSGVILLQFELVICLSTEF